MKNIVMYSDYRDGEKVLVCKFDPDFLTALWWGQYRRDVAFWDNESRLASKIIYKNRELELKKLSQEQNAEEEQQLTSLKQLTPLNKFFNLEACIADSSKCEVDGETCEQRHDKFLRRAVLELVKSSQDTLDSSTDRILELLKDVYLSTGSMYGLQKFSLSTGNLIPAGRDSLVDTLNRALVNRLLELELIIKKMEQMLVDDVKTIDKAKSEAIEGFIKDQDQSGNDLGYFVP